MAAMEESVRTALTAPARPASEVLAWSRELTEPGLRDAIDELPPSLRQIAGYHLGWWDDDGRPTGSGSGKAIRPTLVLLAAQAVGGDAHDAISAASENMNVAEVAGRSANRLRNVRGVDQFGACQYVVPSSRL